MEIDSCSPITRLTFPPSTITPQSTSPLFTTLPGEIRNQIFAYALASYPDLTKAFSPTTCYKRPSHLAPRKTCISLLQTCKAIYEEAWFRPWSGSELSFYLAWTERRPPNSTNIAETQDMLNHLAARNIDPKIEQTRVYAQLCNLEDGRQLQNILDMKNYRPVEFTVTIRHTDFWSWEVDVPLSVGGEWVNVCCWPETLKRVRISFESLERKKDQVEQIAKLAGEKWNFKRRDGRYMRMVKVDSVEAARGKEGELLGWEVEKWTGGSSWNGARWIRDEVRPGQLDYYIATVTFVASSDRRDRWYEEGKQETIPGTGLLDSFRYSEGFEKDLDVEAGEPFRPPIISTKGNELEVAGIAEDTPLDELRARLAEWRQQNSQSREWGGDYNYGEDDDEGEEDYEEMEEEYDEDDDDDDDEEGSYERDEHVYPTRWLGVSEDGEVQMDSHLLGSSQQERSPKRRRMGED